MPRQGRTRRAAARQTQLGQKKKRAGKSPAEAPPAVPFTPQEKSRDTSVSLDVTPLSPTPAQPVIATRSAPTRTETRPAVYRYVGPEIKRIAIVTAGMLAVLIVLTVLLR